MLRDLRVAAGVDMSVLASALKISPGKIEALEANQFERLPDIAFARSLAATVCRHLGADARAVLALMPASVSGLRVNNGAINQPFYRQGDRPTPLLRTGPSRNLLIAVGVVLVCVLLVGLWPTLPIRLDADAPEPPPTEAQTVVPPDGFVLEESSTAALESDASAAAPAAAATPGGVASSAASAAQGAGAALMQFVASDEVWIQVLDAEGKTLLERTLQAGDAASLATGALPLSVKVGRANAVTVKVRGRPFAIQQGQQPGDVVQFKVR
jgi:cytoskeleton protein RodZ